ncbi:MAG: hypothetical protein H6732_02265 [Alphaproteobacteria bacterium]|nr:hypothetical protein [Alphaproteobacteria bacterium]
MRPILLLALTLGLASADPGRPEVDPLLRAIDLPVAAVEARQAGYRPDEVREVIDAARRAGMSGGNAAGLLRRLTHAAPSGKAVPGLAQVARDRLDAGVRGKALVEAIDAARADALGPDALKAPRGAKAGKGARAGQGAPARRGKGAGEGRRPAAGGEE